ncbi:protein transport protein Sec24C-like isoform X4 [Branchiostoma lanceolatum]|uniref:protein transport protein Sec24C-like isoform X4 n=1 Tax=Branchiostoma lanceolatum TaxID=7740 RepID=UPI003453E90F
MNPQTGYNQPYQGGYQNYGGPPPPGGQSRGYGGPVPGQPPPQNAYMNGPPSLGPSGAKPPQGGYGAPPSQKGPAGGYGQGGGDMQNGFSHSGQAYGAAPQQQQYGRGPPPPGQQQYQQGPPGPPMSSVQSGPPGPPMSSVQSGPPMSRPPPSQAQMVTQMQTMSLSQQRPGPPGAGMGAPPPSSMPPSSYGQPPGPPGSSAPPSSMSMGPPSSMPPQMGPPGPMYSSAGYAPPASQQGVVGMQKQSAESKPKPNYAGTPGYQGQFGPPPSSPGAFGQPPPPGAGGMGGYQGQPVAQPPQQRRLDPDQIPSPIQVIEDDRTSRGGQQFATNTRGLMPPLVTTDFLTIDQGNCNPAYMRATMYNIPTTADMYKQCNVPMSLVIKPFTELKPQEAQLCIVDHGAAGPVRCNRCKAYMCPFMQFVEGGRRFMCSFCSCVTDVPDTYFAHLDHTGRRIDVYQRPELACGSYEFIATLDYCKQRAGPVQPVAQAGEGGTESDVNNQPPSPPAFIFMIEASYNSVKNGMLPLLAKHLKGLLDTLPREAGQEESSIRVGFVTFNKVLHFYNVKGTLAQPQMLVVSDVADVFLPLLDGFLVTVQEARAVIDSLLEQIPQMFSDTRETEICLGPVVQAGLEALKAADCAGKLFVFQTSLPLAEAPGKLKNRDDRKLLGTDKEKTLFQPQTGFYQTLGKECVAQGCCVDIFLFPNQYVDVATISEVCKLTGGQLYKYNFFTTEQTTQHHNPMEAVNDGERFIQDLTQDIQRPIVFDAIMRVRTSTGFRPVDFLGNFYMSNTTDVELGAMDCDKAVAVDFKHDDKLSEELGAYIQCAVLYTSVSGQRRLRVHNLSLNCCSTMADLYKSCEMDAIMNILSKQAVRSVVNSTPKAIREQLMAQCANILATYRKNCASPSSAGQLILPECMKLLPLYVNCVLKSDALQGGAETSTDDRAWLMHLLNSMDISSSGAFFYPRLLPLHNLSPDKDDVPMAIRCSIERMKDNGVYLLENGVSMFMWIGMNVDAEWIQSVFGVQSVAQIDIDSPTLLDKEGTLLSLDNPLSARVRNLVQQIRSQRSRFMKLTIVRQRDKLEPWFQHFLVEDKGLYGGASYVDFLCHMHKEIRNLLS